MFIDIFSGRWGSALLLAAVGCGSSADGGDIASSSMTSGSMSSSSAAAGGAHAGAGGAAGSTGSGGSAGGAVPLPQRLVLTGTATGTSPDMMETVTCDLEGELQDLVEDGDDLMGFFSGEFLRRVEVGTRAFQFEPLVAGAARVDRVSAGMAEIRLVGDQPSNAKPYWLQLEVLAALEVAPYEFEGSWSCAPLEIDGNPPDYNTTVTGAFRLAPPR